MKLGLGYVAALAILIACTKIGQAAEIGWPEAVGRLAAERSKAEICVAALKRYGDKGQVLRGRLSYSAAKADSDAVSAELIIVLAEGSKPESLTSLEDKLARSASALAEFCKSVSDLLPASEQKPPAKSEQTPPATSEQKPPAATEQKQEPSETILGTVIKPLVDAVAAIYTNYRYDKAATRLTIRTQLEATKWPDFDEVKPVR
jgi:hypothetical protein